MFLSSSDESHLLVGFFALWITVGAQLGERLFRHAPKDPDPLAVSVAAFHFARESIPNLFADALHPMHGGDDLALGVMRA